MITKHKINWFVIKNDFLSHPDATIESLADKYLISKFTISRHCKAENWRAERHVSETKAVEAMNEDNFEAVVDQKSEVNTNHQRLAHNAVLIVNQMLATVVQKMATAQKLKKASTVTTGEINGILAALERAINLERVTQGLPTSVSKSEVTNNIDLRRVFSDQKLIKLATSVGINAGQLASIGVGAVIDNKN